MSVDRPETRSSATADDGRVSLLDEALWTRFGQSRDLSDSARVWLTLQMRQIPGAVGGAVVVGDGAAGYAPIARWPADAAPDQRLVDAVEAAIEREAPAVTGGSAVAVPLTIDGDVSGAAALLFERPPAQPTEAIRQLRWGMGWLVEAMRAALMGTAAQDGQRMSAVLDLVGVVLDARGVGAASLAAANLLARETGCVQAGLGFLSGRRGRLRLAALSDIADFRLNTGHTRAIEHAMQEAVDQEGTVLCPARPDASFMVDRAHAALRRETDLGEVLTVPLFDDGRIVGALHLEKPDGATFSVADVMVAEGAGAVLGPLLGEKRRVERPAIAVVRDAAVTQLSRLVGPRYLGRKVAIVGLAGLAAFLALADGTFRVKANAEVQGLVIRSIAAPFDGNIAAQHARAGDVVRAGDVLASLDETDLRIEHLRAQTDTRRLEGEYDRALAERDAPEARIAAASLAEATARAELVSAQLARAELRAPFDAVVTSGDLSQSLGAAVRRGEELFQLAPLERYRVRIEVEETDLDEVAVGQAGTLVLASLPGEDFPVRVTRITPRLEARDGLNVALVEGEIDGQSQQIRPGMRGVAKVAVEERLLVDIWTRPIIDWVRLAIWRWMP